MALGGVVQEAGNPLTQGFPNRLGSDAAVLLFLLDSFVLRLTLNCLEFHFNSCSNCAYGAASVRLPNREFRSSQASRTSCWCAVSRATSGATRLKPTRCAARRNTAAILYPAAEARSFLDFFLCRSLCLLASTLPFRTSFCSPFFLQCEQKILAASSE